MKAHIEWAGRDPAQSFTLDDVLAYVRHYNGMMRAAMNHHHRDGHMKRGQTSSEDRIRNGNERVHPRAMVWMATERRVRNAGGRGHFELGHWVLGPAHRELAGTGTGLGRQE